MTNGQLAETIRQVLAYRGWHTPEKLDQSYRPDRAPVGGATIRRIINGEWDRDEELVLLRLAGMLRLPPRTLILVRAGDAAGIERLAFLPEDESVRQLIVDIVAGGQPKKAAGRRTG